MIRVNVYILITLLLKQAYHTFLIEILKTKKEKKNVFLFFFQIYFTYRRTYTTTTATKKIYDKIIKKSIYTYIFLPYYYILI